MNSIEKAELLYGYDKYVPFRCSDELCAIMDELLHSNIGVGNLDLSLRDISSQQVIQLGKAFLVNRFDLHNVRIIPEQSEKNIIKLKNLNFNFAVLCRLFSKRVSPFAIPIDYKFDDYYSGGVVLYDIGEDINALKKMKLYYQKIILSRRNTIINASSYVHEIVHTQVDGKGSVLDSKNSEVLSIFMELLFLYDLDSNNFLSYIGLINRVAYMLHCYLIVKENSSLKSYEELKNNYYYSKYLVSTLKAINIFYKYINSNSLIRNEIDSSIQLVFNGQMSIDDFLSLFDINIEEGLKVVKEIHFC
jgi:hypothetical protein